MSKQEGKDAAGKDTQKAAERTEATVKKNVRGDASKAGTRSNKSIYTAAEFAAGARRIFGTGSDMVKAALRAAGINSCTVEEAREHVERFMKKEVK